jgi:hypothetical protein
MVVEAILDEYLCDDNILNSNYDNSEQAHLNFFPVEHCSKCYLAKSAQDNLPFLRQAHKFDKLAFFTRRLMQIIM